MKDVLKNGVAEDPRASCWILKGVLSFAVAWCHSCSFQCLTGCREFTHASARAALDSRLSWSRRRDRRELALAARVACSMLAIRREAQPPFENTSNLCCNCFFGTKPLLGGLCNKSRGSKRNNLQPRDDRVASSSERP